MNSAMLVITANNTLGGAKVILLAFMALKNYGRFHRVSLVTGKKLTLAILHKTIAAKCIGANS